MHKPAPTHPWTAPPPSDGLITYEELRLAQRNPGTPAEALRFDITPIGLHYILTRFDIPFLDPRTWRLHVDGLVERKLALDLATLRQWPMTTLTVTMECAGNDRAAMAPRPIGIPWLGGAVGTATWTGVRLAEVLNHAGLRREAVEIAFFGADRGIERGYQTHFIRALVPEAALHPDVLLALAMNDQPLPIQHGAPLRLIVPGWYGMASVKWLTRISAVAEPIAAYHQRVGYHFRASPDAPGVPITTMRPRALMVPPGEPDFPSGRRHVPRGPVTLGGRAWSGAGARIVAVAVACDGQWRDAELGPSLGPYGWRSWSIPWRAEPGLRELACRATDANGATQPLDPLFDAGGMGNNGVQRIAVVVE